MHFQEASDAVDFFLVVLGLVDLLGFMILLHLLGC